MTTFRRRTKKDIIPVDKRVNAVPVYMDELNNLIDGLNTYADVVESRATALETYQASGENTTGGNVSGIVTKEVTLNRAAIIGTAAGQLGHADGVSLAPAPGAGYVLELISATLIYDFGVAGYGDGGNITINIEGGAALTGVVSAANSLGAAADKIVQFYPLATAGVALTANKGLNLEAAAAFTDAGGTSTSTVSVRINYRIHKTNL